jgi:hypothetical protein
MHTVHFHLSQCDSLRAYVPSAGNLIYDITFLLSLGDVFLEQGLKLSFGLVSLLY